MVVGGTDKESTAQTQLCTRQLFFYLENLFLGEFLIYFVCDICFHSTLNSIRSEPIAIHDTKAWTILLYDFYIIANVFFFWWQKCVLNNKQTFEFFNDLWTIIQLYISLPMRACIMFICNKSFLAKYCLFYYFIKKRWMFPETCVVCVKI